LKEQYKILISLLGIQFNRGMGFYILEYLPYLCREFKDKLIIVSHNIIPESLEDTIISNNSLLIKLPYSYAMYPFLEQLMLPYFIKKNNIRLAWFPANTFPLIKYLGTKYIVTIHDLIFLDNNFSPQTLKHKIGKWYRKFVLEQGIYKMDVILSVSMTSLKKIVRNFNLSENLISEDYVIYSSLNLSKKIYYSDTILKKLNIAPKKYFYTITGESPSKNFHFVLQSYSKLIPLMPEYKLVVSGIKNWAKYYNLIKKLGLKNKIIFTDFVSEEEKFSLMKNAKAFLFLSKEEGFGRPIIEALSVYCPVIVSDIEIFHEVGGDVVYYVDIKNENALFDFFKKNKTITPPNPEKINRHLLKFDTKINVEKLMRIFVRCLNV